MSSIRSPTASSDPLLGADQQGLLPADSDDVLHLFHHRTGLCLGQVDLVDDQDKHQIVLHSQIGVGQGLGLDPLRGVDDQERPLTGRQAAGHLIRKVDVTGSVDQVECVFSAVTG
jgi:hypothetical protein